VAEELLEAERVPAVAQEHHRAGVAEGVGGTARPGDTRLRAAGPQQLLHPVAVEWVAVRGVQAAACSASRS